MIDAYLGQLAELMSSTFWLAPLMALAAGILTSLTPCSLSSIPLVIGYVGGVGERSTKKAFLYSLAFAGGMAVTFIVLGVIAASMGRLLGNASSLWHFILGVLMVMMALQVWELFNFIPSTNLLGKSKKRGVIGAFIAGILGGIFSSPCSTPVLVALLAIVAKEGSFWWGIVLMLFYAIGHSGLILLAGTSMGLVQRLKSSSKYTGLARAVKIVMGTLILLVGFYMFWLAF